MIFSQKPSFCVNARAIIERETPRGTEVLMQRREKPGHPRHLKFSDGQLQRFEGILEALNREVREETGLTVTALLEGVNRTVNEAPARQVECLTPSLVYQTTCGPVESVGFFFRVRAEGELTRRCDHMGAARRVAPLLRPGSRGFRLADPGRPRVLTAPPRGDRVNRASPTGHPQAVLGTGALLLIRHASAGGQAPRAPLTPEGETQARRLAETLGGLGITRIMSSPWKRATDTVRPLAERLGLLVETDERLTERVLCGTDLPDWRTHLPSSFADPDLALTGGESGGTARQRIREALAEARDPQGITAIVTHGNLLALALGLDFSGWEGLRNPDVVHMDPEEQAQRLEGER